MPPIPIQPTGAAGRERAARRTARQAATSYDAALADLTTNWADLTAAARSEALRRAVVLCLHLVNWLIERDLRAS